MACVATPTGDSRSCVPHLCGKKFQHSRQQSSAMASIAVASIAVTSRRISRIRHQTRHPSGFECSINVCICIGVRQSRRIEAGRGRKRHIGDHRGVWLDTWLVTQSSLDASMTRCPELQRAEIWSPPRQRLDRQAASVTRLEEAFRSREPVASPRMRRPDAVPSFLPVG